MSHGRAPTDDPENSQTGIASLTKSPSFGGNHESRNGPTASGTPTNRGNRAYGDHASDSVVYFMVQFHNGSALWIFRTAF
jgi:hypothetical protein